MVERPPVDDALRAMLERHGVDVEPRTNEALRVRAIALRRAGKTIRDVARELGLPVSTTGAWLKNVKPERAS
jgi:transposase-like protein